MAHSNQSLRIRGLIRLMNRVRDQLRAGIPAEEAAAFRSTVREAVRTVERLCRENRTTPEELPTPSRRAYDYLRALDLRHLPLQEETPACSAQQVRISGIIATCTHYEREFGRIVSKKQPPYDAQSPEILSLVAHLRSEVDAIAALCEDAGATPGALPAPSRRGYQWLRFLSNPDRLACHLETLAHVTAKGRRLLGGTQASSSDRALSVRITITSMLYRTQIKGNTHHVLISEGFIGAPAAVLDDLTRAALGQMQGDREQQALKSYAASEAFHEVLTALHATTQAPAHAASGQVHDLEAAFARVNRTYFDGTVARPQLVWSRTRTRRKMGHYDALRDTVMVSQSLDDSAVPAYVVDYVVYHELLHKVLGTQTVNGRRHAHTPAFRKAERAFQQYTEARRFVNQELDKTAD